MIDCPNGEVRDVLPEYLHDRLEPRARAAVAAHLATCELCTTELALLSSTRDVLAVAPGVDVDRIVAALPSPARRPTSVRSLPSRDRPVNRWPASVAVGAAAAALLVASLFNRFERNDGGEARAAAESSVGPARPGGESPVFGAEPPAQARAPRATLPELTFATDVADLSAGDLVELIAELDLMESLPAVEPQPVLHSLPATGSGDD